MAALSQNHGHYFEQRILSTYSDENGVRFTVRSEEGEGTNGEGVVAGVSGKHGHVNVFALAGVQVDQSLHGLVHDVSRGPGCREATIGNLDYPDSGVCVYPNEHLWFERMGTR